MNTELWRNITEFNLDLPLSEYGFSTRLETENLWTVNFASDAIIEYKKFMYLAATTEFMVSPSEIVDIVWHQHLIFTQSYDAFCLILGKKIAHIPSTHNKADYQQFMRAKENTGRLYAESFGVQPSHIWDYSSMYAPLSLEKSSFTASRIITIGMALFIPFLVAAYFLLRPLYETIDNPYFLFGYMMIVLLSVILLEIFNRSKFKSITSKWHGASFVFHLTALELLYLKKNELSEVIHGVVNQLVSVNKIGIAHDGTLRTNTNSGIQSARYFSVLETVSQTQNIRYPELLARLKLKPVFVKTERAMEAFKKYFSRSKEFIGLFAVNFSTLLLLFLIGVTRLWTGIAREKPVAIITIVLVVHFIFMCKYLYRLKIYMGSEVIPKYFSEQVLDDRLPENNWEWNYYLLGSAVFVSAFVPLALHGRNNGGDSSGGDSSGGGEASGGSGCGSSCGSCGGCGGD